MQSAVYGGGPQGDGLALEALNAQLKQLSTSLVKAGPLEGAPGRQLGERLMQEGFFHQPGMPVSCFDTREASLCSASPALMCRRPSQPPSEDLTVGDANSAWLAQVRQRGHLRVIYVLCSGLL